VKERPVKEGRVKERWTVRSRADRVITTGRVALQLTRGGPFLATAVIAGILSVAKGIEVAKDWPDGLSLASDHGLMGSALAQNAAAPAPAATGEGASEPAEPDEAARAADELADQASEEQSGSRTATPKPSRIGDPDSYGLLADVAAQLRAREAAVAELESSLAVREAALQTLQIQLDGELQRLEAYRDELQGLAEAILVKDEEDVAALVKVYENMKAKAAAAVFDGLETEVLLSIARHMREQKLAAILAHMSPPRARIVTAELASPTPIPPLP
jgi:flagellar motility protein MotE (MotC chaperone)